MSALYILPCSATKARTLAAGPMPARDAYTGQAFRVARHHLERSKAKWCILSGYYGFLWPSTWIENYEAKMQPVTSETVWDECFGMLSDRQYGRLMSADSITVLGSRLYAEAAAALLRRPVDAPLAGLPIGKMLSQLSRASWLLTPAATR
jgi:hypothetical protein